ncbi:antitoxin YezG family protein [Colwellia sp. D2M02]|uniref:immunity protein YezG family protein n=1 Tax=Colwellia sp. D2M02 TaxID=2841562 RepID=UPI001C085B9B|nr:immunity protein YezG family protein [Colwellia sp. D2M02]MBU2894362.1 antitoxin YezG family protein [Colwellia sp. D2M02]
MRTIDDIYMGIAQHLIAQLNDSWKECKIETEFFEDAAEFDVTYVSTRNETIDLTAGYNLFKLFKELHKITTENSDNKWNKAKYTLEPTGKFNIDFEWDQELADEIERLNNE